MPNLEEIHVRRNKLSALTFGDWDFSGFPNLRVVDFSENLINTIYPLKSQSLEIIKLRQNNIYYVDEDAFRNVTNLTHVILSDNRLRMLPLNVFVDLVRLDQLEISNNMFPKEMPMGLASIFNRNPLTFRFVYITNGYGGYDNEPVSQVPDFFQNYLNYLNNQAAANVTIDVSLKMEFEQCCINSVNRVIDTIRDPQNTWISSSSYISCYSYEVVSDNEYEIYVNPGMPNPNIFNKTICVDVVAACENTSNFHRYITEVGECVDLKEDCLTFYDFGFYNETENNGRGVCHDLEADCLSEGPLFYFVGNETNVALSICEFNTTLAISNCESQTTETNEYVYNEATRDCVLQGNNEDLAKQLEEANEDSEKIRNIAIICSCVAFVIIVVCAGVGVWYYKKRVKQKDLLDGLTPEDFVNKNFGVSSDMKLVSDDQYHAIEPRNSIHTQRESVDTEGYYAPGLNTDHDNNNNYDQDNLKSELGNEEYYQPYVNSEEYTSPDNNDIDGEYVVPEN
eukprot:Pgem_evm1s11880